MSRIFACLLAFFTIISLLTAIIWQNSGKRNILQTVQQSMGEKPEIALTFDDGPHRIYTEKMLEGLKKRGVKATFFLQGQNIQGNEKLLRQMKDDGHLIGNHTFHHVELTKLSEREAENEVISTSNEIYKITGVYTAFVRPPFGKWKEDLDYHVTMIPVDWSVDSRDWLLKDTEKIVKNVLEVVKDGDIILMHDCYKTSVEAAMLLIDTLQKQGYEFVTVDKLILQ